MSGPWIEFAPEMTAREAIALEPTTAEHTVLDDPREVDHVASAPLPPGELGNPATVLIAIRYREGTTYCAATAPNIARQFAADLISAADAAEGKPA